MTHPQWPKDNQEARNAFYGDPGRGQIEPQMIPVTPPFSMYYTNDDGSVKKIKSISFHRKAAPYLLAALDEIWDYCQHDQAKVNAAGASKYFGAYNHRMVRGSSTKWSNHAYATAIDLNAGENALGVKKGTMPQFIVDAFCRQGAMWGGWYQTRPDWMHFEFVDNGGRKPLSDPPVFTEPVGMFDPAVGSSPAVELEEDDDQHEVETPPSTAATPINVQPEHAQYSLEIEVLQTKLIGLNYHEIGLADGLWGGKTRGAVTAFMNDRGKSPDGLTTDAGFVSPDAKAVVTNEVSRAVSAGWSRPIAPDRANATVQDIAPKVEIVKQTLRQRLMAKITAGFAGIGLTGTTFSSSFDTVREKMEPIHNFFAKIPPEVWFLALGIVAGLVWYLSTRGLNATKQDYNTGRIN